MTPNSLCNGCGRSAITLLCQVKPARPRRDASESASPPLVSRPEIRRCATREAVDVGLGEMENGNAVFARARRSASRDKRCSGMASTASLEREAKKSRFRDAFPEPTGIGGGCRLALASLSGKIPVTGYFSGKFASLTDEIAVARSGKRAGKPNSGMRDPNDGVSEQGRYQGTNRDRSGKGTGPGAQPALRLPVQLCVGAEVGTARAAYSMPDGIALTQSGAA